jgi:MerR family copper efflux transcriptional regulator
MENPSIKMLDLELAPAINVCKQLKTGLKQMNLSIRQAGQETGLSHDTLRYYERIGLLGPVTRNSGGQRRYNGGDIARLRFVKRAQAMDFSLEEIGQLLALREQQGDVRDDVRRMTETKLAAIEERIESLTRLRDELAQLISACRTSERGCPIIARMDSRHEPAGEPS